MATTDSIHGAVSGKIGPVNYYQQRGSGKMIVRSNPARNTNARKYHPRFEPTRQQNREFKGCVKAAGDILDAIFPVKCLGDFNSFGHLVRICKFIQQFDPLLPKGRRPILYSRDSSLLNGFSFNKKDGFETLVKAPLLITIDRHHGTALAVIPSMRPGIHLTNPRQQPNYRFVFSLGKICDIVWNDNSNSYETRNHEYSAFNSLYTSWYDWKENFPGTELHVSLPNWDDLTHRTLVSGMGIEFGKEATGGQIQFVKYAGAGKIWTTA